MSAVAITIVAVCALACFALLVALRRRRARAVSGGVILEPRDHTTLQAGGAVRSVQSAELSLPVGALEQIWSPQYLERLARTYWRFLSRVTLGVIRVHYSERERFVVALFRGLKLLTFRAPEYEMDDEYGLVRWRIERGLLVAHRGRGGRGYLQILVRRLQSPEPQRARLFVEVEVASFYPAIAFGISRRLYDATQSRIHVIITHAFLRSLARLDLAESRVGRFAEQPAHEGSERLPVRR
ncbi:MAG: hypothetical protein ACRDK2_02320 [Solirubrobacteraceae bacterium]